MSMDRRRLMTTLAGAAGVAAACRWSGAAETSAGPPLLDGSGAVDWRAVRGLFDLDPNLIPMSSFFLASHPRPVREAIERWRRRIDANPLCVEEALLFPGDDWRRVKNGLAAYAGAPAAQLAWVPNTTSGLALVYNGLGLAPGDEILTTEHDHYSHHQAIALAAAKRGASVRKVALHDGAAKASAGEMVDRLRRAVSPATRAVGLTWVHSSTGLKLPIAEMAAAVAAINGSRSAAQRAIVIVDGVHGFGVEDVDAAALGADFFVAGTHKWILGPRGTGLVLGKSDAWPRLRPTIPSFESLECWEAYFRGQPLPATQADFVTPGGFVPFEHLLAIDDALEIHRTLGRARISARIRELNTRLRQELAAMPGVTLHTPLEPALAGGIVCFEVAGLRPAEVASRLRARGIVATESPYAVPYARVAAGIMVQPEEIETTLREIRTLAKAA
jgi:selenocysteine lyase/cysteine desulfurase